MFFFAISTALVISTTVLGSAPPEKRYTPSDADCISDSKYIGWTTTGWHPSCGVLTNACLALNTTYIWHKSVCVAAATCDTPTKVATLAACRNHDVPEQSQLSPLSTNIFSNIVGGCTDCAMSQQNYIDFFYGELSAVNTTTWPIDVQEVITSFWEPMIAWTATGDSIPYSNLNDFMLYGNLEA